MVVGELLDVLAAPDDFFADRPEESRLREPALILLAVAVLQAIPGVLVFGRTDSIGGEAVSGSFATTLQVASAGFSIIIVFVVWLLVAAVVHGLSGLLAGDSAGFRTTLGDVGWGFGPMLVYAALRAGATWYTLQDLPQSAPIEELLAQHQATTPLQAMTALGLVAALWQGLIWTYATHHRRGLDLRWEAAYGPLVATVLVAVGIFFGLI